MLLFLIIYSGKYTNSISLLQVRLHISFVQTNIQTAKYFILLLQVTCEQYVCQVIHNCLQAIQKKFGLFITHMYTIQSYLTYTNITLHTLLCNTNNTYIKIYIDLHILIYQLIYTTLCKYAIQYIKEQHNNNEFNAIKKVLNHRLCYTIITV